MLGHRHRPQLRVGLDHLVYELLLRVGSVRSRFADSMPIASRTVDTCSRASGKPSFSIWNPLFQPLGVDLAEHLEIHQPVPDLGDGRSVDMVEVDLLGGALSHRLHGGKDLFGRAELARRTCAIPNGGRSGPFASSDSVGMSVRDSLLVDRDASDFRCDCIAGMTTQVAARTDWHGIEAAEAAKRLEVDVDTGLSDARYRPGCRSTGTTSSRRRRRSPGFRPSSASTRTSCRSSCSPRVW